MTVFFAFVGLEIRREISSGELGSWRRASVPIAAALGGMIVPASIYAAVLHSSIGARGWEVPMATRRCVRYRSVGFCRRPDFCAPAGLPDDRSGHGRHRVDHHSRLLLEHPPRGAVPAARSHEYPCHGRNRGPAGLVRSAAGPRCRPLVRAGSGWRGTSGDRRGDRRNGTTVYGRWDLGASARPPRMGTATRARLTLGILPVFAVANAGVSLRRFNFSAAGALTVFVAVVVARVLGKPLGSR
jgi:hypothetical protein